MAALMPPLAALLADWVLTACWPLAAALGVPYYSGVLFATAGLVIGGLILVPSMAAYGRWRVLFDRRTAPILAAMGFFSGLATVIYVSAVAYTTPANAAIMAQVEVLYSAVLCIVFLGERVTGEQGLASSLVIAGTGLIMWHDLSSPRWKGDLMIVATPWMYQVSHMISRRLPKDVEPVTMAAGRIFFGVLMSLPFCAWSLLRGGAWSWEPRALMILLAQGVFMSCVNYILWYQAIGGMDLSKATTILLSYPALTVVFSWALGRESLSAVQLVGLVVTLTGASWVSRLVIRGQPAPPQLLPETPGTDLVP